MILHDTSHVRMRKSVAGRKVLKLNILRSYSTWAQRINVSNEKKNKYF